MPDALAAMVERAVKTGLAVEATIDPAVAGLDTVRGLAVLRLTQEGLTNVAKHAGPSARARLRVRMLDGAVHRGAAVIRVPLVDDQRLVRAGLRMLCESAPDMPVVGEAENGQQSIRLAEQVAPDVVLTDLRMPVVDGMTATARIRANRPAVRVVVLTTFDDDHLFPALAAGASGFLVKDAAPGELLAAVRSAAAGETPFSPAVLRRLVDQAVRARLGEAPAARCRRP